MKAALLLLAGSENKVFHPDCNGKMLLGSWSSLAAGDGLWAGAVGLEDLGNAGDSRVIEIKGNKSTWLAAWPKLGAHFCTCEGGLRQTALGELMGLEVLMTCPQSQKKDEGVR